MISVRGALATTLWLALHVDDNESSCLILVRLFGSDNLHVANPVLHPIIDGNLDAKAICSGTPAGMKRETKMTYVHGQAREHLTSHTRLEWMIFFIVVSQPLSTRSEVAMHAGEEVTKVVCWGQSGARRSII